MKDQNQLSLYEAALTKLIETLAPSLPKEPYDAQIEARLWDGADPFDFISDIRQSSDPNPSIQAGRRILRILGSMVLKNGGCLPTSQLRDRASELLTLLVAYDLQTRDDVHLALNFASQECTSSQQNALSPHQQHTATILQ